MIEGTTRSKQTARRNRQTRHKKKTFTDRTYGARLPYEDARVLDDYAEQNKLDGADVVRLAVKQFVARQEMKGCVSKIGCGYNQPLMITGQFR